MCRVTQCGYWKNRAGGGGGKGREGKRMKKEKGKKIYTHTERA